MLAACCARIRVISERHGQLTRRALWAAGSTVWCKRDNGGWGPNYATSWAISWALPFPTCTTRHRIVPSVARSNVDSRDRRSNYGSEVIEFWPDIVRHHKRKQAEKLARQGGMQSISQPAPQAAPRAPLLPTLGAGLMACAFALRVQPSRR